MDRQSHLVSVTAQVPNPAVAMSFGWPVYGTSVQVITANGQQVGQATQVQQPMIPADFTDEVLAALNGQLVSLGLRLERTGG